MCTMTPMVEKGSCSVEGCADAAALKGMCRTHYHRNWRLGDPLAPLTRHPQGTSVTARFWSFVERGDASALECWIWRGNTSRGGYGLIKINGRQRSAHRVAYELMLGQIPDGMTLDHLCHTNDTSCPGGPGCQHRACVNPAHLEPVTGRVNRLRGRSQPAANALKTHCPKGHPYDESNTYVNSVRGGRICRECNNAAQRAYQERKRRARQDE